MMSLWNILPIFMLVLVKNVTCSNNFIDKFFHDDVYNKKAIPRESGDPPLNVTVQMFIISFGPIDDTVNTYDVTFYFRHWWNDYRLRYNDSYGEITLSNPPSTWLWVPDTTFPEANKVERIHTAQRTVIKPSGDVYTSQRMKVKAVCHLDFRAYPFDRQLCGFKIESYAYNVDQVNLQWHERPHQENYLELNPIAGYDLIKLKAEKRREQYLAGGNSHHFNNLELHFTLQRSLTYFLFQAFVPSILLMVLNLSSYYIPAAAAPARVTLIVTSYLTSTFILKASIERTVKLSFMNPMQLFLTVNIMFIVASMVQYIIVLTTSRRMKQKKISEKKTPKYPSKLSKFNLYTQNILNKKISLPEPTSVPTTTRQDEQSTVHGFDKICRILVPILYAIFCTTYWLYYIVSRNADSKNDHG